MGFAALAFVRKQNPRAFAAWAAFKRAFAALAQPMGFAAPAFVRKQNPRAFAAWAAFKRAFAALA
jgi:hypothetical protein